eukprot:COSAG02_NODE_16105_length_1113_cov_0.753452_2_plen_111_part_00
MVQFNRLQRKKDRVANGLTETSKGDDSLDRELSAAKEAKQKAEEALEIEREDEVSAEQDIKKAEKEMESRKKERAKREGYFPGKPYDETALATRFNGHGPYRLRLHADPA